MENFVLNLFADQLSRIILDFHRTEISKCPRLDTIMSLLHTARTLFALTTMKLFKMQTFSLERDPSRTSS